MGNEIERKLRTLAQATHYRQGYLSTVKERTVRVRIAGNEGTLTVKGLSAGTTRKEYEYAIPVTDADEMIDELCEKPIIEKNRYKIPLNGVTWEVDEFLGVNHGLVVAEVELRSEDQSFIKPEWIGEEVTGDPKYFNANLVARPFTTW